jgi:hypothetical protein
MLVNLSERKSRVEIVPENEDLAWASTLLGHKGQIEQLLLLKLPLFLQLA